MNEYEPYNVRRGRLHAQWAITRYSEGLLEAEQIHGMLMSSGFGSRTPENLTQEETSFIYHLFLYMNTEPNFLSKENEKEIPNY